MLKDADIMSGNHIVTESDNCSLNYKLALHF